MGRTRTDELLLGEWACLGILQAAPAHGFAIAARLRPEADIGRVWSMSRALTYRSLEQLTQRNLITAVGEEPGIAGGNRTILATTRRGRQRFRTWLHTPVVHLRDLRSELLLKLVLAADHGIDTSDLIAAQRTQITTVITSLQAALDHHGGSTDPVALWRLTTAQAAVAFLDQLS